MSRVLRTGAAIALACTLACGGRGPEAVEPGPPSPPPAPWSAPALEEVPELALAQWSRAENRETCALLVVRPAFVREAGAVPRGATFGGGWGIAYDLPGLRSAFGVAGTGVEPGPDTYDDWPHRIRWADGSRAGYGPEGGSGPKQLAYLRVAGQRCLYNVWSHMGLEHLERVLSELRLAAIAER